MIPKLTVKKKMITKLITKNIRRKYKERLAEVTKKTGQEVNNNR
jgi:hypothetical protein